MKHLVLLLSFIFLISQVRADSWDDFSNVDRMWDGQKTITNQEFEQVMEKLEEKEKTKEEKKKKKRIRKVFGSGQLLHSDITPSVNNQEVDLIKSEDDGLLLNVPVQIFVDGNLLETGFYNVFSENDEKNKKKYLKLYQSQYMKAKIEMTETQDDYGKDVIDFVEILPYNNSFIKLIFGSVEFNAYALIPYSN